MSRSPRLFFLVFFVSCATSSNNMPLPDGGGGAGGTGLAGNGGGGGSPPIDAAPFVDAGACAPFAETYTQACLACLAASCCDVALMCFQVPDCFGYASCQQNCPPPGLGGNDGGNDAGSNDAGSNDGGGSDGGSDDGGSSDAGSDDGGSSDGGGSDGGGNLGGGNVCLDACAMNYPMAQPAFGAMAACLHANCAGACPY